MRHSMWLAVVGLSLAGAFACGGSDSGDPSSHGSGSATGWDGFTVQSAYMLAKVDSDGKKDLSKVEFILLGEDWSCSQLRESAGPPPSGGIQGLVEASTGVVAGDYPINDTGTALFFPPQSQDFDFVYDGTITVTSIDDSSLKGSFDLTADVSGTTVNATGSFDAPFCNVPAAFQ